MYMSPVAHETSVDASVPAPWSNPAGRNLHEQNFAAHETLFCEGDDAGSVYEVVEGVVCNYQILMDGRRQVISFAYPGDLIGLGHSDTYRQCCEAVCKTRVRRIPKRALLHDAQEHADIGHHLLEIVTAELASMQEHQLLLGRKSAVEKLATFLLTLARRYATEGAQAVRFQLPMTRTDIADFLGMTIETVSRNMTKLKVMGVIDLPQTTTVIVRDIDRLEDLAEGDEGAF